MNKCPKALGWKMPAEWHPHEATWLAWPHNQEDWPGKFAPIPWVFAEIVRQLHYSELVYIVVSNREVLHNAKMCLQKLDLEWSRISFFEWPTDRVWIRDYGPIFLVNSQGELGLTDWKFNAWSKYENWQNDNRIPSLVLREKENIPAWTPSHKSSPVVLEGGSIEVNGEGLLLTTEECLLSPIQQRNPGLSRKDIEELLADYLGINKILWLKRGIAGDDTHGHVDDLARFVNPQTIVTVVEENPEDTNYAPLQENLDRLCGMTDENGRSLDIVPLPMPSPVIFDGQRLPASYANFYIATDRVLVPTFNDPKDRQALGILGELFMDREVIGIHCLDLVWGLGTIHCMTLQEPKPLNP